MRWAKYAILVLAATIVQANLLQIIAIAGTKPNLLLILLVFFAIYYNTTEAIITSFTIGFAFDLIAPSMGPGIISFTALGTAIAYLHRIVAIRQIPYQAAAIFIAGLLTYTLMFLLNLLRSQSAMAETFSTAMGICLYSALLGPFLFLPSAWWMNIKTTRFKKS